MLALQYVKSVPRYLLARYLGRHWNWIYTSGFACLRLTNIDPQRLPDGNWVRVRTILSGICGSDLATITAKGSTYFSPLTSSPFVFGHEVVAEVAEIGEHVRSLRIGDRVVLEPPLSCEVRGIEELCLQCRAGRPAQCESITRGKISPGIQTGFCRDTGGGWSANFIAHHKQLHRVPVELSDEEAVLIEPFSCSLHAVRNAPLENNKTVVVLGAGSIGALTVAAIRALGSRCRVVVVVKYPHQQQLAGELGADIVIRTGKQLYSEMARILGATSHQPELGGPVFIGGADICLDCIGSNRSIDDALRFTRSRGSVILVGMPGIPRNIDWTSAWYKELRIRGSYTSDTETFQMAVETMAKMKGKLRKMVGAPFSLADYKAAIASALHTGKSRVIKTVFRPAEK